ncbi:hypothetical protein BT93_H0116 [Corymbia citriodora subsp. variegata]|nr:hypothetical protein BT93_H0116 [Corymbia citriodora subsp. variegata]
MYANTHPPTHLHTHTHTDGSKNALPFINIIIFYYNYSLLALGYGLPLPSRSLWHWLCAEKPSSSCWRTLEHTGTGTGMALIRKHGGCSRSPRVKNFSSLMIMIYM